MSLLPEPRCRLSVTFKVMRPEAACGAAILNEGGELLLLQRLTQPEAGCWGLPGGKIDFGETATAATAREIAEELGIEIHVGPFACLTETIDGGDGRHWVAPVYEAHIVSGTPRLMEPAKHGGWGWFSLDDLPEKLTTPTHQYLKSIAT